MGSAQAADPESFYQQNSVRMNAILDATSPSNPGPEMPTVMMASHFQAAREMKNPFTNNSQRVTSVQIRNSNHTRNLLGYQVEEQKFTVPNPQQAQSFLIEAADVTWEVSGFSGFVSHKVNQLPPFDPFVYQLTNQKKLKYKPIRSLRFLREPNPTCKNLMDQQGPLANQSSQWNSRNPYNQPCGVPAGMLDDLIPEDYVVKNAILGVFLFADGS